jgi:GNAT superfamily N-acetyltransferase
MSDPNENSSVTLPTGHRVRFRLLKHGELEAVRELCAGLSLRTRYLRFLSPMPVLPESLLHLLADVDDPRRLTLIAEQDAAHGGRVIGLGNMAALDEDRAELGLVVADSWQRQGIGVALAARLLHAADLRGFRRFVVHGRWDNPGFRQVLVHTADVISETMRFGVSEVMFARRRFIEVSAISDHDVTKARG